MAIETPAPREGYRARKVTDKRGGQIEPENYKARVTGPTRGKYPKGTVPKPERIEPGKSGDPSTPSSTKSNVVPPVVWRESGDSRSTSNPLK